MNALHNLARVTTATNGTGTITLGAAITSPSQFLTFAQAGVQDGAVVTYAIEDGANSWIGKGTWDLATNTLTRDETYRSTGAGNNTDISLSGSAKVSIAPAAEDFAPTVLGSTPIPLGETVTEIADLTLAGFTASEQGVFSGGSDQITPEVIFQGPAGDNLGRYAFSFAPAEASASNFNLAGASYTNAGDTRTNQVFRLGANVGLHNLQDNADAAIYDSWESHYAPDVTRLVERHISFSPAGGTPELRLWSAAVNKASGFATISSTANRWLWYKPSDLSVYMDVNPAGQSSLHGNFDIGPSSAGASGKTLSVFNQLGTTNVVIKEGAVPGGPIFLITNNANALEFYIDQAFDVYAAGGLNVTKASTFSNDLYANNLITVGSAVSVRNDGSITMRNSAGTAGLYFTSGTFEYDTRDVALRRDAAGILAQRNGVNAQSFRVYNTFTNASNGEWLGASWSGNVLSLGTNQNGTGVARPVQIIQGGVRVLGYPNGGADVTSWSDGPGALAAQNANTRYNTAFGIGALSNTTSGDSNVGVGYQALFNNTTGLNNTGIGLQALFTSTTGGNNVAIGYHASVFNTTGHSSVSVGYRALFTNTTGYENVAAGYRALYSNTTGSENVAVGYEALFTNTTGIENVGLGHRALFSNNTGTMNVGVGFTALYGNTTGSNNFGLGFQALYANTTGSENIGIGYQSLVTNITGSFNVAVGSFALNDLNISGSAGANTAIGRSTGRGIVTGVNNTILGANVTGLDSGLTGSIILAIGDGSIKLDYGKTTAARWTSPAPIVAIGLYNNEAAAILRSAATITGGATGNAPTLTAGPVTGNPTKWLPYDDNGTTRYIPAW